MARRKPTPTQKERLLEANASRCCVCKRGSIGFNLHHIDGNSSNTVDENLAVLCVEDHDRHHRPDEYESPSNHLELEPEEILRLKNSWEAFVLEANQPDPKVLATLSCYGTTELIHSLQLVMQWPDERIEYKRSFHLLDGDLDRLTDEVFKELAAIGPRVKMALIDQPLPVEHCHACRTGLSRTVKPALVLRLTDPAWATDSSCSVYINPVEPSLAIVFFLREREVLSGSLHLCQGKFLHYASEGIDEPVPIQPKLSVRDQATRIVNGIIREWTPSRVLIGTGDPDEPELISGLELPKCWEVRSAKTRPRSRLRNRRL
jgi:hypothetical protein